MDEFTFGHLVGLLESLSRCKNRSEAVSDMAAFLKDWRSTGESVWPALRLLLPQFDVERQSYGLKEVALARLYVGFLQLSSDSLPARKLLDYRDQSLNGPLAGDFPAVLRATLAERTVGSKTTTHSLTIRKINSLLDRLAASKDQAAKKEVLGEIYGAMPPREQVWLARIILKHLKFGMSEDTILNCYHPDGSQLFKLVRDLPTVTEILKDPNYVLPSEKSLKLFIPFQSQASDRLEDLSQLERAFPSGTPFYMQTKLDGWRFQMHFSRNPRPTFKWFSRSQVDYSSDMGRDQSSGCMAPLVFKHLQPSVDCCILDGELVVTEKIQGSEAQTRSTDVPAAFKDFQTGGSRFEFCFAIFDLVLLNEKCLINETLTTRFSKLQKEILTDPVPGHLEVVPMELGTSAQDLETCLDNHLDRSEEGVMIKDPNSKYDPGSRMGWFKVKPEYFASLADDVDVLLVAGYFGEGRRGGVFSSFACAVVHSSSQMSSSQEPRMFETVCKVGSGLTESSIARITGDNENWIDTCPPWLKLTLKKKPHRFLKEPHLVPICQIRASQANMTAGGSFELRFPRFVQIRADKSIDNMTTYEELQILARRANGRMQSRGDGLSVGLPQKKLKTTRGSSSRREVMEGFKGADVSHVKKIGSIFSGLDFCVLLGAGYEPDKDVDLARFKKDLETKLTQHGGTFRQGPKESSLVICDRLNARAKNFMNTGKYDMIKSGYILDCIREGKRLVLSPRYMIHATAETQKKMTEFVDAFGDSYTELLTDESVMELAKKIDTSFILNDYSVGTALENRLLYNTCAAQVMEKYLDETLVPLVLQRAVIYLDAYPCIRVFEGFQNQPKPFLDIVSENSQAPFSSLEMMAIGLLLRSLGATLVTTLSEHTSHILVSKSAPHDRFQALTSLLSRTQGKYSKRPWIVNEEWGIDCFNQKTWLDELKYLYHPV